MAPRNRTTTRTTAPAAQRGGRRSPVLGRAELFRREMLSVLGKDRAATDEATPRRELGRRKDRKLGKLVDITSNNPRVLERGRANAIALDRVDLSPYMLAALPPEISDAWHMLKRANYSRDRSRAELDQLNTTFADMVYGRAEALSRELSDRGLPLSALSVRDQALYYLAAALAASQRVIQIRKALPTILGILPIQTYNSRAPAYADFLESEYSSLSEPAMMDGGGPGSGGHVEWAERIKALRPLRHQWRVDNAQVERHREAMGQNGAPSWDLLDREIIRATAALMADEANLVAFGSQPGVVNPGGMHVSGALYVKAPTAVDFDQASGEDNYDALRAWIEAQRTAAGWAEGLAANVMALSSPSYFRLKGQFVNSAGGTMNVIDALLENIAGLDEIRVARELAPLPAEATVLQAKGLDATTAAIMSGGIRQGGVQRDAAMLFVDDPEIVAQVNGHPQQIVDNGNTDGVWSGHVRTSSGGVNAVQDAGVALAYQAP